MTTKRPFEKKSSCSGSKPRNKKSKKTANKPATGREFKTSRTDDVICGRGCGRHSQNPGNHVFRAVIKSYQHIYDNAEARPEKTAITQKIVDKMLLEGRRFLSWNPNTKLWFSLSYKQCMNKASQTFRDLRSTTIKTTTVENQQAVAPSTKRLTFQKKPASTTRFRRATPVTKHNTARPRPVSPTSVLPTKTFDGEDSLNGIHPPFPMEEDESCCGAQEDIIPLDFLPLFGGESVTAATIRNLVSPDDDDNDDCIFEPSTPFGGIVPLRELTDCDLLVNEEAEALILEHPQKEEEEDNTHGRAGLEQEQEVPTGELDSISMPGNEDESDWIPYFVEALHLDLGVQGHDVETLTRITGGDADDNIVQNDTNSLGPQETAIFSNLPKAPVALRNLPSLSDVENNYHWTCLGSIQGSVSHLDDELWVHDSEVELIPAQSNSE